MVTVWCTAISVVHYTLLNLEETIIDNSIVKTLKNTLNTQPWTLRWAINIEQSYSMIILRRTKKIKPRTWSTHLIFLTFLIRYNLLYNLGHFIKNKIFYNDHEMEQTLYDFMTFKDNYFLKRGNIFVGILLAENS